MNNKKSRQGAFTVVQAKHRSNGAKVAIKVIYRDPSTAVTSSSKGAAAASGYSNPIPELAFRERLGELKLTSHYITKMVEVIEDD